MTDDDGGAPSEPDDADVVALAAALAGARHVTCLTGAGLSVASGLPDYRGASGLWHDRRFEELASIEAWRDEPSEFWAFYAMRLATLRTARPSLGHRAIARLVDAGHVEHVVTQNVDGLHAAAGTEAIEVHGTLTRATCPPCRAVLPMDEAERLADAAGDGVPRCAWCDGPLKPDVILFGEQMPDCIDTAFDLAERTDLLLVCGSSLAVTPISLLPLVVSERGGRVAIVNFGPTEFDEQCDLRVHADLDRTLGRLCHHLGVGVD